MTDYALVILSNLVERNLHDASFEPIFTEYNRLLIRAQSEHRKNVELNKHLVSAHQVSTALARLQADAESLPAVQARLADAESHLTTLQLELADTLKRRSELTEELLNVKRLLEQTQSTAAVLQSELDVAQRRIVDFTSHVKQLTLTVDAERAARALAADEAEARLRDRQGAMERAERLESENRSLVERMMELKLEQASRMNEVNELYTEVESLRRQAALLQEAAAQAAAQGMAPAVQAALSNAAEVDFGSSLCLIPTVPSMRVMAHANGCLAVAFNHNGDRFATVGGDKSVKIWDASTGTLLTTLSAGMQASCQDVAWSLDDRLLLAASSAKTVHVYDLSTNRERHALIGHEKKVMSVCTFPSDKNRAATCGDDRAIKIWDLQTGYCKQSLLGCTSTPMAVDVSLDGSILTSGHFDGRLRIWELRSGRMMNELPAWHAAPITHMVSSRASGGMLFTLGRDSQVNMVDLKSYECVRTFRADGFVQASSVGQVAVSGEGWYVAAGGADGRITVWDVRQGTVKETLRAERGRGHDFEQVHALAWNRLGAPMVSGDKNGYMVLWKP